jgi:hypothetical protein
MGRASMVAAAFAVTLSIVACGSTSSSTVAGPTPVRCQLAATNSTPTFDASGGAGAVAVTAARECAWTGAAQAEWIALVQPTSGQGDGTLSYRVQPNPAGIARRGGIDVGGVMVEVGQEAAPCRFDLSARTFDVPGEGGSFEVTVQAPAGCPWATTSQAPWIGIAAGAQGTGVGRVTLTVAPNAGAVRAGTVLVAGISVEVRQGNAAGPFDPTQPPGTPVPPPAGDCRYDWQPTEADFPSSGGDGVAELRTRADCTWQIAVDAPWISLRAPASGRGQGDATVEFRVTPNSDRVGRVGRLQAGDATFTVHQAGAGDPVPPGVCTYSVQPASASFAVEGGEGTVTVTTADGCSWSAASNAGWIAVTSGGGTGSGEARYLVEANTGASARTGTLTVAGQTVTIEQGAIAPVTVTVSGAVQGLSGACPTLQFLVDGREVRTSSATTFRRGSCNQIVEGTTVIVRGLAVGGGPVEATEVELTRNDLEDGGA